MQMRILKKSSLQSLNSISQFYNEHNTHSHYAFVLEEDNSEYETKAIIKKLKTCISINRVDLYAMIMKHYIYIHVIYDKR